MLESGSFALERSKELTHFCSKEQTQMARIASTLGMGQRIDEQPCKDRYDHLLDAKSLIGFLLLPFLADISIAASRFRFSLPLRGSKHFRGISPPAPSLTQRPPYRSQRFDTRGDTAI
ncbi:MAG: hypothetical protein ACP5IL_06890 [Syntrophobacteraceae bacterium]